MFGTFKFPLVSTQIQVFETSSRKTDSLANLEYTIYCFWTGNNEMSDNKIECLENLKKVMYLKYVLYIYN